MRSGSKEDEMKITVREVREAWMRAKRLAHEGQDLANCEWASEEVVAEAFVAAREASDMAEALQVEMIHGLHY